MIKQNPILLDFIKYTNIMNNNFSNDNESKNDKTSTTTTTNKPSLSKEYQEKYDKMKETTTNLIILSEFIKQFFSILIHKQSFEHTIQNLFGMYSNMLDQNYYNDNYSIIELDKDDLNI
jgi:hypothetical protein